MNPSTWHPRVRSAIYTLLTIAGLVYGSGMAYLGATGTEPPMWLVGAGAAYAYLAAATGLMAATNTPQTAQAQDAMHEVDALTTDTEARRFRDDNNDGIPDFKED